MKKRERPAPTDPSDDRHWSNWGVRAGKHLAVMGWDV
jgi:hypothetical protein